MAVDFTPSRGVYTELRPFRFWCQKVLPLVYDDSLSYYELLCKVVDFLNKTMEDVETLEGDVTAVYEAYNQLQEYVNDYFDNLNVQDEIDAKLDKMAEDGSLSAIMLPLIRAEVTRWLGDNIEPTTPPVDASLSVTGAAADAGAVGTALAQTVTFRTQLVSGVDLDTLTQAGFYYKERNVSITNGVNDNPAKIVAFSRPEAGDVGASQLWFDVAENKVYYRTKRTADFAWGDWVLVANASEVANESEAVTYRTQIVSGTDLDTLTQAGYYYKERNVSITNGVNDNPAKIIAFSRPEAGVVGAVQLWFDVVENKLYYRTKRTADYAWGSWVLVTDNSEAVTFRTQLSAGLDMDDLTQAGYYYKTGNIDVANVPNNRQAKIITFSRPSAGKVGAVQLWFDVNKNKLLFRTNLADSTTWHEWRECLSYPTKNNSNADCYTRFVNEMQKVANDLGVSSNTMITSPNGNFSTKSTANDMLRILLYAYSFEEIRHIWNVKNYSFYTLGDTPVLKELASTLYSEYYTANCPIIGGKPGLIGSTDNHGLVANLCMISLLDPYANNSPIGACVIYGSTSSNNRFTEMSTLMNNMKNNVAFNGNDYTSEYISAVYAYNGVYSNNCSDFPLGISYASKNDTTQFATASTVKVLTAITVLKHAWNLDEAVEIQSSDVTEGSGNIFTAGEIVKVKDLLYSLILISSNTAAVALARHVGNWLLNND